MGTNRYEMKRRINLLSRSTSSVKGSIADVIAGLDNKRWGSKSLEERWDGLAPITQATVAFNTNLYNPLGANWLGYVDANCAVSMGSGVAALSIGTTALDFSGLGAYRYFYLTLGSNQATYNNAATGIVFEALVKPLSTCTCNVKLFFGLLQKPGITYSSELQYSNLTTKNSNGMTPQRIGFCTLGTDTERGLRCIAADGSFAVASQIPATSIPTTAVNDVYSFKFVYTFGTDIKYYVNNVLAYTNTTVLPASKEAFIPIFQQGNLTATVDGEGITTVYGARVYYL